MGTTMEVLQGRHPSEAVTAAHVIKWFGRSLNPPVGLAQCAEIASSINGCRWAGEPPPRPGDPGFVRILEPDAADAARWWDFKGVTRAGKTLLHNLPVVTANCERQNWSPQGQARCDALNKLTEALQQAMPYIEFPFGPCERRTGRPSASKQWHTYALILSHFVLPAMIKAGHPNPAISRNSVLVRVVREAMIKMGIEGAKIVSASTVSAFLTRWDEFYGLTPQGISALTTNDVREFYALFT